MMIAASLPVQRPPTAKLMFIDARGRITHMLRANFVDLIRPGDLVIANDAATLPASLHGRHERSGAPIEVRLAGRRSLDADDVAEFSAIVFGAGDFHTPTENRPMPPRLKPGDRLTFGTLSATVQALLGHPRMVRLAFEGSPDAIWGGLARDGLPIQYAHMQMPLSLWDVWTPIAGLPVAFEAPSAGFALEWRSIAAMRARKIAFATITHAAGISSTGDPDLDRRLPFDEPYRVSQATARAILETRENGRRVIAIGTTVVRCLEAAAARDGVVRAGDGMATGRIDSGGRLRVVDAILTGTHQPETSHYQLLRAFTDDETLLRTDRALLERGYLTHEFGDSILIERSVGKFPASGRSIGVGNADSTDAGATR
jgi:S-adenosylmethionine:tRNA ribosyltransferase-isomerase